MKLIYGNGVCAIDSAGNTARGVEIHYSGKIDIEDKTSNSFAITYNNKKILVFPIGPGILTDLFEYVGELRIKRAFVANEQGNAITCNVVRAMDYVQLLDTNAEDLTVKSEDLNRGYKTRYKSIKKKLKHSLIENLDTADWDISLYLKHGQEYSGPFHIHTKFSSVMTGATHDEASMDLYFKQGNIGKPIPTKNKSFKPPILKKKKINIIPRKKTRVQ